MRGVGDLTMRRPRHGTQHPGREKERPMEGAQGLEGGVWLPLQELEDEYRNLTKWLPQIDGIHGKGI